ncbi:hypothetical protein ACIGO8_16585 [Streptomyces sp. NPDC053493]|uniref:hypothetical protein n=1 Tax=Streptomyces sp. NPDC053493 TaxID=3365705 RepID=UPI0037CEDA29
MTAEDQCDGAVSGAAAPALERALVTEVFHSAVFGHTPTEGWLDRAKTQLESDYRGDEDRAGESADCYVFANPGPHRLRVSFDLYGPKAPGQHVVDPFMYPYEMAVDASAGYRKAYLYTRCVSPLLKGSDKEPARIRGTLDVLKSTTPDTVATREDNLVVLHSVMLAMVRKLGCADDAGLPATPVIKAKKPRKVWPPGPSGA